MTSRGYHLLWLWCASCNAERPFRHIERRQNAQPMIWRKVSGKSVRMASRNLTPRVASDIWRIWGACMVCGKGSTFVITESLWQVSGYNLDFLCVCGLPWDHECRHLVDVEALHGR